MKLNRLARRLQTALCMQGRHIRINQFQHYSEKKERMVTKYMLSEEKINSDGKRYYVAILETYQMAEVVKALAGLLDTGGEADA